MVRGEFELLKHKFKYCILGEYISEFKAKPHDSHTKIVKQVLWYLKGSLDYGIEYINHLIVKLISYLRIWLQR